MKTFSTFPKYFLLVFLILSSCRTPEETVQPTPTPEVLQQPYQNPYFLTESQKYIYNISEVPEIKLDINVDEWNKLLSYYDQNPQNEEYVAGNFTWKNSAHTESLMNVGLRLRGNTSRRRPEGNFGESHNSANPKWHHASFTVSFKKFVKTQLFHNSEKVILKWFKDDALYAREVYSYDLFEKFGVWTAPQSSYCRLTINVAGDPKPAYFGVYQLIEPVDDTYLANRNTFFKSNKGNLWKANWGASLKDASTSNMGIENVTLTSNYTPIYDYKGNKSNLDAAKSQLSDFISQINNLSGESFKNYISNKMDVPLFLKTYAVNVAVGMWDDYWNNSNNYYFYFDSDGKFYFIPYDYDNTLGTSLLMTDSGKQDPYNWGKNEANPLVAKIIAFPEYKALYAQYLKDLANKNYDLFYPNYSQQRILNWHSKISSYISNDTGEDMIINDIPASWGNQPNYRLMNSDENTNFFKVKSANLSK